MGVAQPIHDTGAVQLDVVLNVSWPRDADDVNAGVNILVTPGKDFPSVSREE